jgi:thiosulfate dehydrogenase (quinone) large subunit
MAPQGRRWMAQTGAVLLPLRAFLAVVFLSGGISKVADRHFLDGTSPTSMRATVLAVRGGSPIGGLLGPVVAHSFAFGLLMAATEVAVGLGLLLGLYTRVAAVGGMVLALSLWLTVSWEAQPWFTSADVVYLFALTPFAIAGSGGMLSADGWLASARESRPDDDRTRRTLVVTGVALIGGLVMAGSSLFRRSSRSVSGPGSASVGSSATGEVLAKVADVPIGGGRQVTDADTGDVLWILQLRAGRFTAFKAACPHQGCPVRFVSPASGFACPCHGSAFDASGVVLRGPAISNLTAVAVTSDGTQVRRA